MVRVEIKPAGRKFKAAMVAGMRETELICLSANLSQVRREGLAAARAYGVPCQNCIPNDDYRSLVQRRDHWEHAKSALMP